MEHRIRGSFSKHFSSIPLVTSSNVCQSHLVLDTASSSPFKSCISRISRLFRSSGRYWKVENTESIFRAPRRDLIRLMKSCSGFLMPDGEERELRGNRACQDGVAGFDSWTYVRAAMTNFLVFWLVGWFWPFFSPVTEIIFHEISRSFRKTWSSR